MLPRQKPHANTSIDNTSFGRIIFVMDEASRLNGRRGRPPERELGVSSFGHHVDDLGFGQPTGLTEALADAVARTRTSNDELHLREGDQLAVVQVDRELEREKVAKRWIATQDLEDRSQGACPGDPARSAICHGAS